MTFDAQGLPLVLALDGQWHYNPVTLEQFALTMYGEHLEYGDSTLILFQAALNKLLQLQGPDGALRYPFPFKYYLNGQTYQPGWVSALAQGQFLSVMVRAFWLTGNSRYLDAGNKALSFLLTPVAKGGPLNPMAALDHSLSGREWLDEYPPVNGFPSGYTLNGDMFTLIGLYEWTALYEGDKPKYSTVAGQHFAVGIDTLTHVLKYYDVGGFSAYDLGHIIYQRSPMLIPGYHRDHIYLLQSLFSIRSRDFSNQ